MCGTVVLFAATPTFHHGLSIGIPRQKGYFGSENDVVTGKNGGRFIARQNFSWIARFFPVLVIPSSSFVRVLGDEMKAFIEKFVSLKIKEYSISDWV